MWKLLGLVGLTTLVVFLFIHPFKEPLEGFDRNKDGVRDDLEAYIDKVSKTSRIRLSMRQVARDYQSQLLDMRTPYEPLLKVVKCLLEEAKREGMDGVELMSGLQTRFANTKEREATMIHFSSQFNGRIFFDTDSFNIPCPWEKL